MKSSAEIRKDFLDFFAARGHTIVASGSLGRGARSMGESVRIPKGDTSSPSF
jgi:hypothetical protein